MPQRYSPDSLGLAIREVNRKEAMHGPRRIILSFAVLRTLFGLAEDRIVKRHPSITAQGSTIQARRGGVGFGNEFAHQVLRELSIDDVPIHLLEGLSTEQALVLTYCNAAVSQIRAVYNRADQLIEERIREPFNELARR